MSLRAIIQHIATARGLVLEDPRPGDAETFLRFRVPAQRGTLDLDEQLLSIGRNAREATITLLGREVTGLQRTLFRATTDYIARHDREPLDRLRQIEAAGRALLDALGPVGLSRTGNALTKAALDLEALLRIDPRWFAKHAGHKLVPINEYGGLLNQCPEYVSCVCGSHRRCTKDADHGDHDAEARR